MTQLILGKRSLSLLLPVLGVVLVLFPHSADAALGVASATSFGVSTVNSGADNATDLQNALNSGAAIITLSGHSNFKIGPAVVTVPSGISLQGVSGTKLTLAAGTNIALYLRSNTMLRDIAFDCSVSGVPYKYTVPSGVVYVGSNGSNGVPVASTSDVTIANCTFQGSKNEAVHIVNTGSPMSNEPTVVEDCTFNSVFQAVGTDASWNLRIYHNKVFNTISAGIMFWGTYWPNSGAGSGCARTSGNINVEYNTVINAGGSVVNARGAAGIWCSGCQNVNFSSNTVDGAQDGGLDMEWTSEGWMYHNTTSRTAYGGIAMFFSSEDIVIADNHITNNVKSTTNGAVNAGIYFADANTAAFAGDKGYKNVLVYNNTIVNTAKGAWSQRAIWAASNTSANIQVFGNSISGDAPIYVNNPPVAVKGTGNFTLNGVAQAQNT